MEGAEDNMSSRIKTKTVMVTPDMARYMLARRVSGGRTMNTAVVDEYANMMKRGEWRPRPYDHPILVVDDALIDGQHRLAAVQESQCSMLLSVKKVTT